MTEQIIGGSNNENGRRAALASAKAADDLQRQFPGATIVVLVAGSTDEAADKCFKIALHLAKDDTNKN
jgi:hypothetical protein